MKYIRTQEGHIYEYVEQRIHKTQHEKFGLYRHNLNSEYEPIIEQADTIEELCDRFVLALKDVKKNFNDNVFDKEEYYELYGDYDFAKNYYEDEYYNFYGAIWTDKGLIYVAKMNENGKLELI